jgi:hypothetical protein
MLTYSSLFLTWYLPLTYHTWCPALPNLTTPCPNPWCPPLLSCPGICVHLCKVPTPLLSSSGMVPTSLYSIKLKTSSGLYEVHHPFSCYSSHNCAWLVVSYFLQSVPSAPYSTHPPPIIIQTRKAGSDTPIYV